jgi:hypothetical protein
VSSFISLFKSVSVSLFHSCACRCLDFWSFLFSFIILIISAVETQLLVALAIISFSALLVLLQTLWNFHKSSFTTFHISLSFSISFIII